MFKAKAYQMRALSHAINGFIGLKYSFKSYIVLVDGNYASIFFENRNVPNKEHISISFFTEFFDILSFLVKLEKFNSLFKFFNDFCLFFEQFRFNLRINKFNIFKHF